MKTINRIHAVFARLKLKKESYVRRASFVALMSVLLVSFQNCSQGKFESATGVISSSSNDGGSGVIGNGSNDGSGAPPPPPPADTPPTTDPVGPSGPTQAQIDAEAARKDRCRSAIKAPQFVNAADVANKVVNLKSGLSPASGDVNPNNPVTITVDASQGIDSSKYSAGDLCSFRTSVITTFTTDAGKEATFTSGIDNNGNDIVVSSTNGQRAVDRMNQTLDVNMNPNNNNNAFTMGTNSVSFNYSIKVTQQDDMRTTRCVQGSVYVKYTIRTQTLGLNQVKTGYPAGNVTNPQVDSSSAYAKIEVENNCWKETTLNKIIAAADATKTPGDKAKLGTALAIDGDWAVSISNDEGGTGFIYLFRKVSGNWSFFQKLKGQNGNGTKLTSVALKNGVLAVGSAGDALGYPGRVFLYSLTGSPVTTYTQILDNPAGGIGTLSKFGISLALTAGGAAVIVGDSYDVGKAYLYAFDSSAGLFGTGPVEKRIPDDTEVPTEPSITGFGESISCQNGKVFISAFEINNGYAGSVHIMGLPTTTFAAVDKVFKAPASFIANGGFGYSVAYNGTALAIGGPSNNKDATATTSGSIAYYKSVDETAPVVIHGNVKEERFGFSLAFAGDSLYVGSIGGAGTVGRYPISALEAAGAKYTSRTFMQTSHTSTTGESFGYAMAPVSGTSVPTLMVSARSKDIGGVSTAGAVFLYEVK